MITFAHSLQRLYPLRRNCWLLEKRIPFHYDARVRRSVIQEALEWLLTSNKYYRANQVHLNENVLQQLPENGDVFELTSLQLEESTTDDQSHVPFQEDVHGAHLPSSFVPNAQQQQTEQETVRQSIEEQQTGSSHTLNSSPHNDRGVLQHSCVT